MTRKKSSVLHPDNSVSGKSGLTKDKKGAAKCFKLRPRVAILAEEGAWSFLVESLPRELDAVFAKDELDALILACIRRVDQIVCFRSKDAVSEKVIIALRRFRLDVEVVNMEQDEVSLEELF